MDFSGLTKAEVEYANDLIAKGRCSGRISRARSISAKFYLQPHYNEPDEPNFTVAVLEVVNGGRGRPGKPHTIVGVAKRNPNDDELVVGRGRRIALARALNELAYEDE